jgi:hypothetical protein
MGRRAPSSVTIGTIVAKLLRKQIATRGKSDVGLSIAANLPSLLPVTGALVAVSFEANGGGGGDAPAAPKIQSLTTSQNTRLATTCGGEHVGVYIR